jgi:hypothetical protein
MQKRLSHYIEGLITVALAGAVVLGVASFASAAQSPEGTQPQSSKIDEDKDKAKDQGITDTDLRQFDDFVDKNHDISRQLRKNPNLINDAGWVKIHPKLRDWLEDHPEIRDKFKANPGEFMRKEIEWDKQEAERHHPKKPH